MMKSKNQKKRSRPGTHWTEDDVGALLAYLDHTRKHSIEFNEAVVSHLKNTQQKDVTIVQISRKLRALWNSLGEDNSKSVDDVYIRGSVCLPHLSEAERRARDLALRALEDEFVSERLASRRYLRSASRSDNQPSERHLSLETVGPVTPWSSETPIRESGSGRKRKAGALQSGRSKNCRTYGKASRTPKDKLSKLQITTRQNAKVPEQLDHKGIRDSEEESYGAVEQGELGSSGSEESAIQKQEDGDQRLELEAQNRGKNASTGRDSVQSPDVSTKTIAKISGWKMRAKKRAKKNRDLRAELIQSKTQYEDLLDQIRCRKSAQMQAAADSPMEVIYRQERDIGQMRKELRDRHTLGTFTSLAEEEIKCGNFDEMESRMLTVGESTKQILYACDDPELYTDIDLEQASDLRPLLCRSLGMDSHVFVSSAELNQSILRLSPQAVVRAVAAAALCEWVFETDFPNFARKAPLILSTYREHLMNQDGVKALRNLDMAAHSSIIREEAFQERRIPKKAERLANRLSKTLAPFFTKGERSSDEWTFDTWDQDERGWEERRARMLEVFECSLKAKAASLLNMQRYEMVMFAPGTTFDSKTMDVESMEGVAIDHPDGKDQKVDICVQPLMQIYAREEGSDPMLNATIQSNNFTCTAETRRADVTIVSKAVVILTRDATGDDGIQRQGRVQSTR